MLDMIDLIGALSLADAACALDVAWDAIYEKMMEQKPEHIEAPSSEELREMFHTRVHAVMHTLSEGMGNPAALPPHPAQRPEVDDNPFPGMYL